MRHRRFQRLPLRSRARRLCSGRSTYGSFGHNSPGGDTCGRAVCCNACGTCGSSGCPCGPERGTVCSGRSTNGSLSHGPDAGTCDRAVCCNGCGTGVFGGCPCGPERGAFCSGRSTYGSFGHYSPGGVTCGRAICCNACGTGGSSDCPCGPERGAFRSGHCTYGPERRASLTTARRPTGQGATWATSSRLASARSRCRSQLRLRLTVVPHACAWPRVAWLFSPGCPPLSTLQPFFPCPPPGGLLPFPPAGGSGGRFPGGPGLRCGGVRWRRLGWVSRRGLALGLGSAPGEPLPGRCWRSAPLRGPGLFSLSRPVTDARILGFSGKKK